MAIDPNNLPGSNVQSEPQMSADQAIGQWLDKSLDSMTSFMTQHVVEKNGTTDVATNKIGNNGDGKTLSGKDLSSADITAMKAAANRDGGGTGLYTKTHKGEWVGTHTMEGMLVTARANQELTNANNVLTKGIEQKGSIGKNVEQAAKALIR